MKGVPGITINIQNITKRYRNNTTALHELSFTIGDGVFGLLGPNGAGKTTLLRVLATLLSPDEGTAFVCGLNVRQQPHIVRRLLGYLPQEAGFYKTLTPIEYLDFVAAMKQVPTEQRKKQVNESLELVNLTPQRDMRIGGLSGGMKRRLGIAQAIIGNPKILILDEPTVGLDPAEQTRIRSLLASLGHERTVVLSTHIIADIESTCRYVAVLQGGKLLFSGQASDLIRAAQGNVWKLEATGEEFERFRHTYHVIAARQTATGVSLRIVSSVKPSAAAEVVEPTLEDAYLCKTGGPSQ